MNTKARRKIQKKLNILSQRLHPKIPLDMIFQAIEEEGFQVVMEDGKSWGGLLLGEAAEGMFDIKNQETGKIEDRRLFLQWYRYETGRYEITAYVS